MGLEEVDWFCFSYNSARTLAASNLTSSKEFIIIWDDTHWKGNGGREKIGGCEIWFDLPLVPGEFWPGQCFWYVSVKYSRAVDVSGLRPEVVVWSGKPLVGTGCNILYLVDLMFENVPLTQEVTSTKRLGKTPF